MGYTAPRAVAVGTPSPLIVPRRRAVSSSQLISFPLPPAP